MVQRFKYVLILLYTLITLFIFTVSVLHLRENRSFLQDEREFENKDAASRSDASTLSKNLEDTVEADEASEYKYPQTVPPIDVKNSGNDNGGSEFPNLQRVLNFSTGYISDKSKGIAKGLYNWEKALCRWTTFEEVEAGYQLSVFGRDVTPNLDDFNIYLVETSCVPSIDFRKLCALESFAVNNPDAVIWFLLTSNVVDDSDGLITSLLQKFPNIRFSAIDFDVLLADTGMESLLMNWNVQISGYLAVHMSDIARVAIVWKYGGLYSDSDVICLQSVQKLENVIGLEFNKTLVGSSVFHMTQFHPLLEDYMAAIMKRADIKGVDWTMFGPEITTLIMRKACNCSTFPEKLPMKCGNITLLPHEAFNPLNEEGDLKLFTQPMQKPFEEYFPKTLILHLTGSSTEFHCSHKQFKQSYYAKAAKEYCPTSRKRVTLRNRFI